MVFWGITGWYGVFRLVFVIEVRLTVLVLGSLFGLEPFFPVIRGSWAEGRSG